MTPAVTPVATAPTRADPREQAFCDRNAPEVFHSVANPTEMWRADPFDVDAIHAEARDVFRHLLVRAAGAKSPLAGKVLLLHGVAGSGKTHLMRAFRTLAHRDALGYCGYMQMAAEVGNYARYALQNLIDRLEERYDPDPDGPDRTGLARLASGTLDAVPGLTAEEKATFRQEEPADPAAVVEGYADRLAIPGTAFGECDLALLRVLLHLQRPEPRVRNRALMWLRCQDMTASDRAVLGDIVPRTQEEDPQRMLAQLARVAMAVHRAPLVFLIDQLEDMANQSMPVERFRKLVDVVTALTDQVPSAVVVVACLEDYYEANKGALKGGKQYRLEKDPEPLRLTTQRTLPEIRTMLARRLGHLFAAGELDVPEGEIAPFTDAHLAPLANLPTRQVLDNFRRHYLRCARAEKWLPPAFDGGVVKPDPDVPDPALSQLWNDFHSAFKGTIPDEEDDLAAVLARAIRSCGDELPDPLHFGEPEPDTKLPNLIEVDVHTHDGHEPLVVAVCDKKPQGTGLAGQVAAVAARADGVPVALVRTTPFPVGPKTKVNQQIAQLLKQEGRRVVVENAEWRRMLAFEAFRTQHGAKPGLSAWQRAARPLGELRSLQDVLGLKSLLAAKPRPAVTPPAVPPAAPPSVFPTPAAGPAPKPAPVAAPGVNAPAGFTPLVSPLHLGQTIGVTPRSVDLPAATLATHAAFIGSTKSGKTTAALALIEQLLLRGVPAVLLDRKGDLARYADPAAWAEPPLDAGRIPERDRLRALLDVRLFTPGAAAGRPLGLPVVPPGFADLPEADREQFARYAAAALGAMLGFKSTDADRQQQAILAQAIQVLAEAPGAAVGVPALRELVKEQDDALVTRVGGFKAQVYEKLADRLLTLWLGNKQLFADGEALDVDALLGTGAHAAPGRVRLSVVSTKFLAGTDQVDFWVAQFLVAVGRWCAKAPSDRLQAVFFFDEADQYLPAQRQPVTKGPMTDLLKRARSAGVGVMLATQNPGDFDYKCRENVLTWLVGRVTEPRSIEKLRPVLSAAKGDATGKLAGQKTGEFHVASEKEVAAVRVAPSLVKTEQLSDDRITALARATPVAGG